MKALSVKQGSPEWFKAREQAFTASLAPAVMGAGYNSRDMEMEYALGIRDRDNSRLENLFAEGQAAEAAARPVFEKRWNVSVSPIVGVKEVDGMKLLASFDGITMDYDLVWEHKFTGKVFEDIPPLYYWQLEHQLLVSGAEMAVLTVTSRKDGSVTHYAYKADQERQQQLIEGWQQWQHDLENYERKDGDWLSLASDYKDVKAEIDRLTLQQKQLAARLQEMAGQHTAMGGGVRVSVLEQWEERQTPAAYIKKHGIDLPVMKLDAPKYNYRITINKEK